MAQSPREASDRLYSNPIRLVLIYIVIGGLWTGLSDELLVRFSFIPLPVNRLLFVAITAVLLYVVIRRNRIAIERSDAAKRQSTARIEGYFKLAAEGLVVVDRASRIVEANTKAEQMFGYAPGELIGQPIENLVPERVREKHRFDRGRLMESLRSRSMGRGLSLTGVRKDGTEFPIEVSLSYVPTDDGGLFTGFITDSTERHNLEFQARRSEAMAAVGTVAAGVAHELNNPLAIISARAELVVAEAKDQELPEQLKSDLEVIQRNAQRASRIATELLTLARHPQKARTPLSLNDLVNDTLLLFREQTRNDGIVVETRLDRLVAPMLADPTAMGQVLVNLLINARDSMPEGGEILIRTERMAEKPDHAKLIVSDSGKGIPPELIGKIFDLFFTTKTNGTGLGLWLSRRTVREHGGTIEAKSEPGHGTTFTLTFPTIRKGSSARQP